MWDPKAADVASEPEPLTFRQFRPVLELLLIVAGLTAVWMTLWDYLGR